jgi:hypothetical protein
VGTERRRRRLRRSSPAAEPAVGDVGGSAADPAVRSAAVEATPRAPTPHDLAELGGTFALTAEVMDPDEDEPGLAAGEVAGRAPGRSGGETTDRSGGETTGRDESAGQDRADEAHSERGLRGLVGGGSSQVSVEAALRARDAARPTDADLATAEAELVIVRRGWVPREELPPRGPRR